MQGIRKKIGKVHQTFSGNLEKHFPCMIQPLRVVMAIPRKLKEELTLMAFVGEMPYVTLDKMSLFVPRQARNLGNPRNSG